ncbi:MAG: hypothetical protein P8Y43_02450 [Sulfurovaceae bacterium]
MSEHGIYAVFHNGCKTCPAAVIEQSGDAEVLFNDISFFGDLFIPGNLGLRGLN